MGEYPGISGRNATDNVRLSIQVIRTPPLTHMPRAAGEDLWGPLSLWLHCPCNTNIVRGNVEIEHLNIDRRELLFEHRYIFPVSRFGQFVNRDKAEGCRIHTVAQTGRRWPIFENMAKVGISQSAPNLCSYREEASIFMLDNVVLIDGPGETWPAGA